MSRLTAMVMLLVGLHLLVVSGRMCLADDVQEIQTWLDRQAGDAAKCERALGRFKLEWETRFQPGADREGLAKQIKDLENRVAGKPDHPDRGTLMYLQAQQQTFDRVSKQSWFSDAVRTEARWRLNTQGTTRDSAEPFHDFGHDGRDEWALSPEGVEILRDAAALSPHLSSRVRGSEMLMSARARLADFVFGGLWVPGREKPLRFEHVSVEREGSHGRWQASLRLESGGELRIAGGWSDAKKSGWIESTDVISAGARKPLRTEFTDIEWSDSFDRFVARGVRREIDAIGGLTESRLILLESVPEDELERTTNRPLVGSTDVVRGVTVGAGLDGRGDTKLAALADGVHAEFWQPADVASDLRDSRVRHAGWVVMGGLICLFIVLRARALRRAGAS